MPAGTYTTAYASPYSIGPQDILDSDDLFYNRQKFIRQFAEAHDYSISARWIDTSLSKRQLRNREACGVILGAVDGN